MRTILLLLCAIALFPVGINAKDTDVVWVSILRSDGILVPVSTFDGNSWSSSWPEIEGIIFGSNIENLSEIPKQWLGNSERFPQKWYLTELGGSKKVINVTKPELYNSHCGESWGLRTDYPSKESRHGYTSKVGIAFSKSLQVMPAIPHKDIPSSTLLTKFIVDRFLMVEEAEVQKKVAEGDVSGDRLMYTGHPIDPSERKHIDVTIEELNEMSGVADGNNIYYFAAERKYNKPRDFLDRSCEAISHYMGFLLRKESGGYVMLQEDFAITDCDMQSAIYSTPFGAFKVGNDWFLVKENTYYESEVYFIDLIRNGKIYNVTELFGGGC